jgi:HemY protein
MIRVVIYLLLVGVLALGVNWLADRPGEVTITWWGWRLETSVMIMLVAVAVIAAVVTILWSFLGAILRSPREAMRFWQRRKGRQGYLAISRGLIAIGAGDARAARKHAEDAKRLAPEEPLALLLGAQTAQMSGDRPAADRSFRAMASRPDTKLIGLRGLFIEAQRRGDASAAQAFAAEAAASAPSLGWAGEAVLQFSCASGDWDAALDILKRNQRAGVIDRATFRRQRAVLITAQALALQDSGRDRSRSLALEAAKLAPDLVPAVALAARFLAESGELRKGTRLVEKAWQANPHPDLAEAYADLRLGDSARERLARVQGLADKAPDSIESALALARAAVAAKEFSVARAALAPYLMQPTRRVALLMAHIEEADRGDEGRAREWMNRALSARRDPAWTADGFVSDRWLPLSPVSGRLDAFEWKVPLAEIESAQPSRSEPELPVTAPEPPPPATDAADMIDVTPAEPAPPQSPPPLSEPAIAPQRKRKPRTKSHPRIVEPVIPLAHVPDDPGPEPDSELEPAPEASQIHRRRTLF